MTPIHGLVLINRSSCKDRGQLEQEGFTVGTEIHPLRYAFTARLNCAVHRSKLPNVIKTVHCNIPLKFTLMSNWSCSGTILGEHLEEAGQMSYPCSVAIGMRDHHHLCKETAVWMHESNRPNCWACSSCNRMHRHYTLR